MKRKKITVAGAGNVGATTAFIAAQRQFGNIVLIDIVKGLAEGKALDMAQASSLCGYDSKITGTTDWALTADSDVVLVTSGMPRKPGMSRDDLLAKNTEIVKSVTEQIVKYSRNSFIIVVCNPLDAMVNAAAMISGFEKNKVMGMAGALDTARFTYFVSEKLGVSVNDIKCVLMGGHGDDMVPLARFTTVSGIPVTELIDEKSIAEMVQRARMGGIEIVNLMGTSAFYAPAAGAVTMAESILLDKKMVMPCCAYCDKEYNVGGCYVGVPVILGADGVEKVIELDLNEKEKQELAVSVSHVKELVDKIKPMV
ncbi:MAG: malate dehydrogenase [Planctomycetes bacterium GWF2_41_51]|nr:MAG: malate dehydrogenase [Planctomycetes bacterium GWF2_41_51]HBG26736.1 malate dehydrogenase [Phycisphaerales bacterium]